MYDPYASAYRHTQKGYWCWMIYIMGAGMLTFALLAQTPYAVNISFAATGAMLLLIGMCFQHLTVLDDGDRLTIRFGPLPLFQKQIRYIDIRSVEVSRTTFLDGWGIHYSLRGGWVWNIHGRDCVRIDHGKKTWVGTDDPHNLAEFLKTKIVNYPV